LAGTGARAGVGVPPVPDEPPLVLEELPELDEPPLALEELPELDVVPELDVLPELLDVDGAVSEVDDWSWTELPPSVPQAASCMATSEASNTCIVSRGGRRSNIHVLLNRTSGVHHALDATILGGSDRRR
jgi:hypothetical protein